MNNCLEMVQHNAAKFISNCYPKKKDYKSFSISKILSELELDSIEERRNQAKLTMAYKIINEHLILDPTMLPKENFQRPLRQCNSTRVGAENQLFEKQSQLKGIEKTFFFSVPKLWNDRVTPSQAKDANVDAFKRYFFKN